MLVAFMESKLVFVPGGKHTYENEDPNNDFCIPDTFDGGKYSDDIPLPDNKISSRSEENEGGVESKSPNDAVLTKAVQLKLNQSMIKTEKYQILPFFMIHVAATEMKCK